MADRHIAAGSGDTSQDMVTRDVTDPWQEICDLRDEIERLQAELRDLRKTSSRALWDARNIASALMLALEWHRKSPMLKGTQADQRRHAVDIYDTWQKDWNQVDHTITPPGWMR